MAKTTSLIGRRRPVEILWEDISQDPAWKSREEAQKADTTKCYTLGYILSRRGKKVRIASTLSEDNESDVTVIPKGCILSIRELHQA